MRAVHHRIADLEEFQRTSAEDFADRVAARVQDELADLRQVLTTARTKPRGLTERDFWMAIGFLSAGVAAAKVFPWVQSLVQ